MKVARLGSLMLIAIFAMSLAAASAASAAHYLFRSADVGATFNGISLAGSLVAGANTVTCEKDVNAGSIANVHLIGPFIIHFLGCKSSGSGGSGCVQNSVGQTGGLILTTTLHALLGLVLPSGLPGLLVLPVSGKVFTTLEANTCTIETKVTGSVAGLIPLGQVGHTVTESLVNFIPKDITKIDTLNGLVEPELVAYATTATLETQEHLEWSREIEVS